MKKVAIIGNSDFSGTSLFAHTTDNSTSKEVIINENTTVNYNYELKNYSLQPFFTPSPKIRSKYKRNLKFK